MKPVVLALSALAMLLASPSFAQTTWTKASPPSAAASAPPQTAPEATTDDPGRSTRQALVRKYFAAIQFEKLLDALTDSMLRQQMASMGQNTRVTPEIQTAIISSVTDTMHELRPDMMNRYTQIYADILTEQELTAMVRFYESDLGHSITAKSQIVAGQSGEVMQEFMPRMMAGMRQRLCAQIACPAETSDGK
jgi:hypothetical protein